MVHKSLSAGMKIEEVGGYWSNRFLRFHWCMGCSLVVRSGRIDRSGHMGGQGVYGVRIVSGVAFLSAVSMCVQRDETYFLFQ